MLVSDYAEQARTMLSQRQAAGMPPCGHLLVLRTDCSDPRYGEDFLRTLRDRVGPALPEGASLIGPLPSPLQRRAGKFRFQLVSVAADRAAAQASATLLVTTAESMQARRDLKWSMDIDPQDLF
jgi:primosomal protein N' (replication factor Y)